MKESRTIFAPVKRRKKKEHILLCGLLGFVIFLMFFSLVYGETIYSFNEIFAALTGKFVPRASFTLLTLRLPRMLAGVLAGFALGVAGYVFQTMLHNPLANPDVLGVSSGASCAVVVGILFFYVSKVSMAVFAIGAGLLTVLLLFGLSVRNKAIDPRMIISGIGLQAFYDAVISYLTVTSNQRELPEVLRWLNGSLDGMTLAQLPLLALVVALLTPLVFILGQSLSLLHLGNETAQSLGVNVGKTRVGLLTLTVIMAAVATSVTGPIAFVSFLAGPLTQRLFSRNGNHTLSAGLVGASLVLAADLIGQYAFSYRFPVGVITGLIGAPYLIWQLYVMNKRGEL